MQRVARIQRRKSTTKATAFRSNLTCADESLSPPTERPSPQSRQAPAQCGRTLPAPAVPDCPPELGAVAKPNGSVLRPISSNCDCSRPSIARRSPPIAAHTNSGPKLRQPSRLTARWSNPRRASHAIALHRHRQPAGRDHAARRIRIRLHAASRSRICAPVQKEMDLFAFDDQKSRF